MAWRQPIATPSGNPDPRSKLADPTSRRNSTRVCGSRLCCTEWATRSSCTCECIWRRGMKLVMRLWVASSVLVHCWAGIAGLAGPWILTPMSDRHSSSHLAPPPPEITTLAPVLASIRHPLPPRLQLEWAASHVAGHVALRFILLTCYQLQLRTLNAGEPQLVSRPSCPPPPRPGSHSWSRRTRCTCTR
jgi:hypothetical protein